MPKERKKPSQEQLREMATHVAYEWGMLRATTSLLGEAGLPEGATRNSILESFLLHARQLVSVAGSCSA